MGIVATLSPKGGWFIYDGPSPVSRDSLSGPVETKLVPFFADRPAVAEARGASGFAGTDRNGLPRPPRRLSRGVVAIV